MKEGEKVVRAWQVDLDRCIFTPRRLTLVLTREINVSDRNWSKIPFNDGDIIPTVISLGTFGQNDRI